MSGECRSVVYDSCVARGECPEARAEAEALKRLASKASWAMRKKLGQKYEDGWSGWDDINRLLVFKEKLIDHVNRDLSQENLVDIMNLAAFIWNMGGYDKANSRSGSRVIEKD